MANNQLSRGDLIIAFLDYWLTRTSRVCAGLITKKFKLTTDLLYVNINLEVCYGER